MGSDDTKAKRRHPKTDREHRKHKRRKHESSEASKRSRAHSSGLHITDDDPNDEDMWTEKNIDMDGEQPLATDIPTAESLKVTSSAVEKPGDKPLPSAVIAETTLKRDEWMLMPPSAPTMPAPSTRPRREVYDRDEPFTEDYGEGPSSARTSGGTVDFFSTLGKDMGRKPPPKPEDDKPKVSYRELNVALREGKDVDEYPAPPPKAMNPGGPGSQWRMMKLRRVYETAEERGIPAEEVALERFESLQAFEEAKKERRILDEREGRRAGRSSHNEPDTGGKKGFMFTDLGGSGASSRSSSFRRPDLGDSRHTTPSPAGHEHPSSRRRFDSLRLPSQGATSSPLAQSHTPVPSVMTPSASLAAQTKSRALSPSSLNKLQAKVLRAKLMGAPNTAQLEQEYEVEVRRAQGGEEEGQLGVRTQVELLPTLDARGRLYDVGHGKDDAPVLPGNRKKKERVETRDPKTGEVVRINADDDSVTLGEMLRQERFGAGMADQKNLDAQFARAVMSDGKFQNDLDYIDDNAEKLSRQKMRSDAMKRQFAINDYKRTQKVLATCPFCYGEDDSPPKAPVIAMGTRVYLSCTTQEELVPGHCLIVPIQHHLTMLEGDDDVWDEVRNFMKCLMQMFAAEDKGVLFYETVISIKRQNHTFIECVPLPWEQFEDIPGYFKESILMSETEWSQHKKLIDFSARPGGFRRAMVPNLPYFMVQFDYKGEKGYGHVIEGTDEAAGDDEAGVDEGEKGGGEFPRYFAGEIIGNVIGLEPRSWRRPRRVDTRFSKERVEKFRKKYDKYDWTGMIGKS